mmetsp:Transcript_27810/g.42569  ORF Transcript_27810/g.42569 Transcript_27810/m.42569 type:complete len:539 (+) Transcript_27810:73-1689(+)|eukprot:CAMPEP_0195290846 /NCGR_PEP_ID=MMETSP0707-20130614/6549_1 /TAXON_ID=33640 /ORGANISM="Asterionellopsis glacialis, Strain CCMP134" /LENGTH=538 /DNA_ID=CAMNT_0040351027 /DNA_START=94 /DNA_END=1710 /DNA_ORIENTATION=-
MEMTQMKNGSSPHEDADLEDLLASDGTSVKVPNTGSTRKSSGVGTMNYGGVLPLLSAHCSFLCYMYPRCCSFVVFLGIFGVMIVMANVILNPTETYGQIVNDYTNIQSEYDLSLGNINHWCIKGDNDSCRCDDPLIPRPRAEWPMWMNAHKENRKTVKSYTSEGKQVDVAFMGESLIEEMDGRWMGKTPENLAPTAKVFRKHFTKEKSGIEGVALGIAGDTSANVLWRTMHGEMPTEFNPKIWWLSLGMNDLGRMQCSEEVVVIGILRVVEQIRSVKPDAKIVINSMLPMADLRGGLTPTPKDYEDAFKRYRGRPGGKPKGINKIDASHFARNPAFDKKSSGVKGAASKNNNNNNNNNKNKDGRFLKKAKSAKKGAQKDAKDPKKLPKMTPKQIREFNKRTKHDIRNPVLKTGQTKRKKFNPKRLFMKQNKLPLWTSIYAINEELRKFSDKHDHITFFDSTDIFAERESPKEYILLSKMVSARGHPTTEGYRAWEDKVAEKVKKILAKEDAKPAPAPTPEPEPAKEESESESESESSD